MKITAPYLSGILLKRYKRFLADIRLDSGEIVTVHTPNTGSMLGCSEPGSRVWIYRADNPKRKYSYSWGLVADRQGNKIGIHTGRVNALVAEGIQTGIIKELASYGRIQQEVTFPGSNTRFDLFLPGGKNQPDCFVEIKNVTASQDHTAIFPDAKTERGRRHLEVLLQARQQGYRTVIFFCIQRNDVERFSPAYAIDPAYARVLEHVMQQGVEALAYKARVDVREISLTQSVPVVLKGCS